MGSDIRLSCLQQYNRIKSDDGYGKTKSPTILDVGGSFKEWNRKS